jgi:ketol-acid reductoisomerase
VIFVTINIYHDIDGDISILRDYIIAIIGFGNQAKAMALNMRDSGLKVIVGNLNNEYKIRAEKDNFETYSIEEAIEKGDIIFLLIPDDVMKLIFNKEIKHRLKNGKTIVFTTGYYITFNIIQAPEDIDILLISPRLLGEGVRERFLNKKGFFTFVHVHKNSTGKAKDILLALTKAIGGLINAAIDLTFKQQTVLSLFTEQAFYPAFDQVLMRSISNLVNSGYPPEAIFVELILSEEGSYTVEKMIDVGLIKQMNFHSQTSQYGSLSRSMKFLGLGKEIVAIQKSILNKIESGEFSREWEDEIRELKLKAMKYFAYNTNFSKLEKGVRSNLGFPESEIVGEVGIPSDQKIKNNFDLEKSIKQYKEFYNQF